MNKDKLISVVVPVYNGELYIEGCIDSIEKQTYPHIEVLIVDDGSTDNTGDICHRLKEKHNNIRLIALGDEGVSAARNKAIDLAEGEYITFVDADDRIHPDMLSKLVKLIEDTDSHIASCSFFIWENEEEWNRNGSESSNHKTVSPVNYTGDEFVEKGILNGNTRCWGKLYKKDKLGDIRFRKDLTIGEDMMFLLDMALSGAVISEIEIPYYGYYKNPKGAMLREFHEKYMDQITCWEKARDNISLEIPKLYDRVTSVLIISIMLTVGKIARLPVKEIKKHKDKLIICRDKLKRARQNKGVDYYLSRGYRMKSIMFQIMPNCYVWLYHMTVYI